MPDEVLPVVSAPPQLTRAAAASLQAVAPTAPLAEKYLAQAFGHLHAGNMEAAAEAFGRVLAIDPTHGAALVNRGAALRRLGKMEEALACYWRALAAGFAPEVVWGNAAGALLGLKRYDEAEAALQNLARLAPDNPTIWRGRADLASARNWDMAAETCLRRLAALAPDDLTARNRLAYMLGRRGRLDEAERRYRATLAEAPDNCDALAGLGQTLISRGLLQQAEPPIRAALERQPDHLDAHLGLARLLLLRGDLTAGWREYEWRRRKAEAKIPRLPGAEWSGEPLAGKTILLAGEQGFGDSLHFVRYVPILAARGARVMMTAPAPLHRLLRGMPGLAALAGSPQGLPPYDYWLPLLSLPGRLGISPETIPARIPYLQAPAAARPLSLPLGCRLRVGVAWAGSPKHTNDQQRSLSVEDLLPLAGVDGVTLYSLQIGPRAQDIGRLAHPALLRDMSGQIKDFADTATIMEQLDLVVCVDTALAHLAGALGKPVWVLLPQAPDWRWILGRDDSPWYPTMRLFRQSEPGRWDDVMARVVAELEPLAAARLPVGNAGETTVNAIFPRPDGHPRYRMPVPRSLLTDAGLRFLVAHERDGRGYEYATRAFIDAHLRAGDLFIDVGAHWGIMSLQAATRFPGEVAVLACEPVPSNLPPLRRWLRDNGVDAQVEVIPAAVSDAPGAGGLRVDSSMGHRLVAVPGGGIPVVTIDGLLAERPALAGRRVIVKIDVEGLEPEVVAGMEELLRSGRVAAVIWEHGPTYGTPDGRNRAEGLRRRFAELGFSAWRFASEDEAGPPHPFTAGPHWRGNVFELAPGETPRAAYGQPKPLSPAQPDDPVVHLGQRAYDLMGQAVQLQAEDKPTEALAVYRQVAELDVRGSDLFNNMGVALRRLGRLAAGEACYRRALAIRPRNPEVLSNLANLVRERGRLEEAAELHRRALIMAPTETRLLYNAALVHRDDGRPALAQRLFEQVLERSPDHADCRWDWALSLLQQGDYRRGWPAYEARWGLQRAIPRDIPLPRWQGEPLAGRSLFLFGEQGFGDVLQWARFIPEAKRRGAGRIVLECPEPLLRLLSLAPGIDAAIPMGGPIPSCDVQAPLLSLPGLLGSTLETLPAAAPYLRAPLPAQPLPDPRGRLRLGVVWAGKPTPRDRSCPLEKLLPVFDDPRYALSSLQLGPRAADLQRLGAHLVIEDLAPRLHDFAETAAVMRQLDAVVTVDTSAAHLAGALGLPTFLLLLYTSDWRWFDRGGDSPWYPSMRLIRQPRPGAWEPVMEELHDALARFADERM